MEDISFLEFTLQQHIKRKNDFITESRSLLFSKFKGVLELREDDKDYIFFALNSDSVRSLTAILNTLSRYSSSYTLSFGVQGLTIVEENLNIVAQLELHLFPDFFHVYQSEDKQEISIKIVIENLITKISSSKKRDKAETVYFLVTAAGLAGLFTNREQQEHYSFFVGKTTLPASTRRQDKLPYTVLADPKSAFRSFGLLSDKFQSYILTFTKAEQTTPNVTSIKALYDNTSKKLQLFLNKQHLNYKEKKYKGSTDEDGNNNSKDSVELTTLVTATGRMDEEDPFSFEGTFPAHVFTQLTRLSPFLFVRLWSLGEERCMQLKLFFRELKCVSQPSSYLVVSLYDEVQETSSSANNCNL